MASGTVVVGSSGEHEKGTFRPGNPVPWAVRAVVGGHQVLQHLALDAETAASRTPRVRREDGRPRLYRRARGDGGGTPPYLAAIERVFASGASTDEIVDTLVAVAATVGSAPVVTAFERARGHARVRPRCRVRGTGVTDELACTTPRTPRHDNRQPRLLRAAECSRLRTTAAKATGTLCVELVDGEESDNDYITITKGAVSVFTRGHGGSLPGVQSHAAVRASRARRGERHGRRCYAAT